MQTRRNGRGKAQTDRQTLPVDHLSQVCSRSGRCRERKKKEEGEGKRDIIRIISEERTEKKKNQSKKKEEEESEEVREEGRNKERDADEPSSFLPPALVSLRDRLPLSLSLSLYLRSLTVHLCVCGRRFTPSSADLSLSLRSLICLCKVLCEVLLRSVLITVSFKSFIGLIIETPTRQIQREIDMALEGSQPVDLSKHPSGIVPTLQ